MEKDNIGYEEVRGISSSLIIQHKVSVQQTCLTTAEEALWEMVSVTVCCIFAMATLCPALVLCRPWNKLSIEAK